MATKFSDIYEGAIFKITDYGFLNTANKYLKNAALQRYLLSAVVDFQHSCRVDLKDYDKVKEQFNNDLDDEIIEILSLGIAYHWFSAKMLNSELLRNVIHQKDYTSYSPGNLLKVIKEAREAVRAEYTGKINTYSFRYGNIDTLKA